MPRGKYNRKKAAAEEAKPVKTVVIPGRGLQVSMDRVSRKGNVKSAISLTNVEYRELNDAEIIHVLDVDAVAHLRDMLSWALRKNQSVRIYFEVLPRAESGEAVELQPPAR